MHLVIYERLCFFTHFQFFKQKDINFPALDSVSKTVLRSFTLFSIFETDSSSL